MYRRTIPTASLCLAALVASSCGGCSEEPLPDPVIDRTLSRLQIIPAIVAARPGLDFVLSVRGHNAAGQLLPPSSLGSVQWKVEPSDLGNLSISGSPGLSVSAKLAPTSTTPIGVGAQSGTIAASAEVQPAKAPTGKIDWLAADGTPAETPIFVLVDGRIPAEWRSDSLIALAGGGPLDEFMAGAGEITVFSRSRRIAREYPAWTTDRCDYVRYSAPPTPAACLERGPFLLAAPPKIQVNLWIMADADDAVAVADVDMTRAIEIIRASSAGLDLVVTRYVRPPTSVILDLSAPTGWLCPTTGAYAVRQQLIDAGIGAEHFGPDKFNVAYVTHLRRAPSAGGGGWAYPGYTCVWNAADGVIAFVSSAKRTHSTLVHEMVHGLGPWKSGSFGHTNDIAGFDESNVMWRGESSAVPVSRALLTLGQAFRLTFDTESFAARAGLVDGGTFHCFDAVDAPCPRLAKDVAR